MKTWQFIASSITVMTFTLLSYYKGIERGKTACEYNYNVSEVLYKGESGTLYTGEGEAVGFYNSKTGEFSPFIESKVFTNQ